MARQMSEKQAWLYLARRWDCARKAMDAYYVKVFGEECEGLCVSTLFLRVDAPTRSAMRKKIYTHAPMRNGLYRWPLTYNGSRQRAAFCRRMAKLCEKEKNNG